MKRTEASLQQWKDLYQQATIFGDLKPWELFWDLDLISIKYSPEDIYYISILGRNRETFGFSIYEGQDGYDGLMELVHNADYPVAALQSIYSHSVVTAYWGNEEELSDFNTQLIESLGYRYEGEDSWLYFISIEPGFYPFHLNQQQVVQTTELLVVLIQAIKDYQNGLVSIDFDAGNLYEYAYDQQQQTWLASSQPRPPHATSFPFIEITDKKMIRKLEKAPLLFDTLEIDLAFLGMSIGENPHEPAVNACLAIIANEDYGIISSTLIQEFSTRHTLLFDALVEIILAHGKAKTFMVRTDHMALVMASLASLTETDIVVSDEMPTVDDVVESIGQFSLDRMS